MPRRILLKESGLTGSPPPGFKFIGFDDSKLSDLDSSELVNWSVKKDNMFELFITLGIPFLFFEFTVLILPDRYSQ
jgi:hypothetical protein